MSETAAPPKIYSLRQVAKSIKSALEKATANRLWMVRAEVVKVNGRLGAGHVYLDLIDEAEGVKQAAMRGVIWRTSGQRIKEELGAELPNVLRGGAEIVFHARVAFHELYGLSLHIEKIDLGFMLGELERRKQATIQALTTSGEVQFNKRLPLARVPQRVALVGSPGTSGFRDFCTVALRNPYGLRLNLRVFEARVQGDGAPADLVRALGQAEAWEPELIVLVRGGGSKIDLDCFNDLALCKRIAAATVPVWTGIGHESDLVVADLVAHTAWKTPTDCANRWVERCAGAWAEVLDLGQIIGQSAQRHTQRLSQALTDARMRIGSSAQLQLSNRRGEMEAQRERMATQATALITARKTAMHQSAESIAALSRRRMQAAQLELEHATRIVRAEPQRLVAHRTEQLSQLASTLHAYALEHTLKRGFAILRKDGKSITNATHVQPGDRLTVQLHLGELEVEVVARTTEQPE
jgi:exodeoxyribonuclease VII large subunit